MIGIITQKTRILYKNKNTKDINNIGIYMLHFPNPLKIKKKQK